MAEVFDFSTKRWTALPSMPRKRAAASGAVVHENKIIVIGGLDHEQAPIAAVDYFDTEVQTWGSFPSLPIGVTGAYVKMIDDRIYVIGGTDKKGCNQSVVFDLDRQEWLSLPPKPTACYACGGYLFDKKLFIVGGRDTKDGKTPVQACEAFDLETKQWEELANIPSIRVFYNVVGCGEEIYVLGGLVPMVGLSKIAEKYSIRENKWTRLKDLLELRSDSACGVVGGRVVVAGGLGGTHQRPQTMVSVESFVPGGKRFTKLMNLFKPRSSLSSLEFEGKLAAMNGVGEGGVQAMVEVLRVKEEDRDKST